MCETYDELIEHPNQDTWVDGYVEFTNAERREALAQRYVDVQSESFSVDALVSALDQATVLTHSHRFTHEASNLRPLGLMNKTRWEEGSDSPERAEYDNLTGRANKVGEFIYWFSKVSHAAYVNQEHLPEKQRFKHVSLELGGKRQFGNWEASTKLDAMARNIPHQLVEVVPDINDLKMLAYGRKRGGVLEHERVTYKPDFKKSYGLLPFLKVDPRIGGTNDKGREIDFDYAIVRRRRPIADIYITGESDLIIFKESLGLLAMEMLAEDTREAILDDCEEVYRRNKPADPEDKAQVRFRNTQGAKLAGIIFEAGIRSASGVTKDIIPVSAHYVQAVGKKYALELRPEAA